MLGRRALVGHNGKRTTSHTLRPLRPSRHGPRGTRHLATATVTDADIARLAAKPLHPLALADLCKHGRPPLTTAQLLSSANFTLAILPARLAHRIQSLRALPYIVVANPNVSKIHNNYVHSLSTLLPWAERRIESLADDIAFTEAMADLVHTHSNTIAILAKGFLEARKYISPAAITAFLDEHLRARIGTRLIAEQHIALHMSSQPHAELAEEKDRRRASRESAEASSYIGVIDTALRPADIVRACEHTVGEICELKYGVRPSVRIVGRPDTTIAHIPMHLEYIVTELLKNSFRATIEAGMEQEPVEVTIAPSPAHDESPSAVGRRPERPASRIDEQGAADHASAALSSPADRDHKSTSPKSSSSSSSNATVSPNISPLSVDANTPGVTIRIRDRGGGIAPQNYSQLWEYGFTTFNEDEIQEKTGGGGGGGGGLDVISSGAGGGGGSSLAGLGYGLPLGRAYAEYFGGGIAVQSMWGWGTDVYLSLRGVGKV